MAGDLLLAIDQGTTGSTSLVLETSGRTLGRATVNFPQHFPQPGWVEHEAGEIWDSVEAATRAALASAGVAPERIGAIGITNQRETSLLWDRATGEPVHRALVWQDRRTAPVCAALREKGLEPRIRRETGLVLDPYFSATKLAWLLDNVDGARARASRGELAFGTVDSFLIWRLAGQSERVHVTDATNASRTLLANLRSLEWDPGLLELFQVPASVLPRIVGSAEIVARTKGFGPLPDGVPIAGIAGDQQAALFGQACFAVGDAKCTYGTGAFALANIGPEPIESKNGLVTTVAWRIGDEVTYALEGSSFIAGAAVQWLRDGLGLFQRAEDIEALARSVDSSDGVFFVPALAGLGAPYWDPDARGLLCGLTRGSTKAHVARAALEGIAHGVGDLLGAMCEDFGRPLARLRVDGGAAANDLLMQAQADVSGIVIERPAELESTGRGAAMLAGLGSGLLKTREAASALARPERTFRVEAGDEARRAARAAWSRAVARARSSV